MKKFADRLIQWGIKEGRTGLPWKEKTNKNYVWVYFKINIFPYKKNNLRQIESKIEKKIESRNHMISLVTFLVIKSIQLADK